ncbi:MAG: hypothetical protein R2755_14295 [Acidimicrobiales bacterium]
MRQASRRARAGVAAAATSAALVGMTGGVAGAAPAAEPTATTVAAFAPELAPEGIAVTPDGTVYVSTSGGGEVWELGADGAPTVEAVLAPTVAPGSFGVLDVAVDDAGRLYAAVASGVADTAGVWTWLPGGTPERIAGSERLAFPNAIAIADDGTVFVSESFAGQVWRADGWAGELELWSDHPWLRGNGALLGPALPVGANGIVAQDGVLYVANTEEGSILRFAIGADGPAGPPTVWSTSARLVGIDGMTVGPDGVIYASLNQTSEVVRISWDTSVTVLATAADGIDFTSDLDFGSGDLERSVYAVNFSIGELFGKTGGAGPGVVRIDHAAPPYQG